ncbi:MAG: ABC transporter ATP-binding protein [Pseudomonadota bacterium]
MSRMPKIGADGRGRKIATLAGFALGQAVAAGVAAFATRDVFTAVRDDDPNAALFPIVAIAVAGFTIAGFRICERVAAERVGQEYAAALREKLFTHVAAMPAGAVANYRAGGLALRFVGDLSAIRGWVSLGLGRLISSSIALPVAGAVLMALNPALGAAAIAPVAGGIVIMCVAGWRLGEAHRRLRARRARLAADMSERIVCAPELRLMGRINLERRKLRKRTSNLVDAAIRRANGAGFLIAIPDAALGVAAAALFTAAIRTNAAPADIAGAMAALSIVAHPMRRLAGVWDRQRAFAAARAKCEHLLDTPRLNRKRTSIVPRAREVVAQTAGAHVTFSNLSAGVFKDLSASVAPGACVALIGPNGAGKSTLLTLAAGLEQPAKGQTRVDGVKPTAMTAQERRRAIAYVGPHSPILAGTMRRALTMGCAPRPDDDVILETADTFGLLPLIKRLGGLDGTIRENARNLSAGEARRLMLSRAALVKPKLLLLDEPDDVLDPEGVDLIRRLLTITQASALIATHNIRTARMADDIWFIKNGAIAEIGTPDAISSGSGLIGAFFNVRSVA